MTDDATNTDDNSNTGLNAEVHTGEAASSITINRDENGGDEELIGGKFKSQEDLLNAYKELERKQSHGTAEDDDTAPGDDDDSTTDDKGTGDETEGESPYGKVVGDALAAAELSADDLTKEFQDNDGTLSEESFEAFEKAGFPKPMVEAYMRGLQAQSGDQTTQTEAAISSIKESVGGDEGFSRLQQFIGSSYTAKEAADYNAEISSGDVARARAAVEKAHARLRSEIGSEADPIGGKAAEGQTGYASEAEMMEDMRNPKYKTSPSFREQVDKKMAASPSLFLTR